MNEQRFKIRIDSWWQPLLLPGGATDDNSYVEISDESVRMRFGWLFDHTFGLDDIESVHESSWPIWYGVGWRTNFLGMFGLIGSHRGVVEVKLRRAHRAWGVLRCQRIAVSLEEPQRFVEAIAKAALHATANGGARAGASV